MENMREEGPGVGRGFMLKQIENEVMAARRALQLSRPAEREADGSEAARVRAVTRQVMELREAVDALAAGLKK